MTATATGNVYQLSSAQASVEADVQLDQWTKTWDINRTAKLTLDGGEILVFPHPDSLPLDSEEKRTRVDPSLDALLSALTR